MARTDYDIERVDCVVCGSADYELYIECVRDLYNDTRNFFDVVKCSGCGFIFTNPRPT